MKFFLVVALFGFLSLPEMWAAETEVDSLYQAALARVNQAPLKESVDDFKRVLKVNSKYAPALEQLTRLYIRLDTPEFRRRAVEASERAVRLEPENLKYQLLHGDALWNQGFQREAKKHYEKVIQKFPNAAEGAYDAGRHVLDEYLITRDRQLERRRAVREFAKKEYEHAVMLLEKSLEIDPDYRDAYYKLGLAHLEHKKMGALQRAMRRLNRRFPDDKNGQLFLALSFQMRGNLPEARAQYDKALVAMRAEERAMMESVDVIAEKEDRARLETVDMTAGEGAWTESSELKQFWNQHDPLFLTGFNERRLEHYGRVAYANLRFSLPSKGVEGWRSVRGQTYIKYGRYLRRSTRVAPMFSETWYYEGFRFTFRSLNGIDKWGFAGEVGPSSAAKVIPRDRITENMWKVDARNATKRLFKRSNNPRWAGDRVKESMYEIRDKAAFKSVPTRFIDPFESVKYSLPNQIAAFREGDQIRLEMAYAIPASKLKKADDGMLIMDDGLFMFDSQWKDVYRKVRPVGQKRPDSGKGYLLNQRNMVVPQGVYHLVVEVGDRVSGSVGTFREKRLLTVPDSGLAMSDVLLAKSIEMVGDLPEKRADLKIVPNPLRTFEKGQSASVYLEVYNLAADEFGQTQYDIAYRVGVPEKDEVDPALFGTVMLKKTGGLLVVPTPEELVEIQREQTRSSAEVLSGEDEEEGGEDLDVGSDEQTISTEVADLEVHYVLHERNQLAGSLEQLRKSGQQSGTAVSSRYTGNRTDDFTFLEIDLSKMPAGIYKLDVTVTDLLAKQEANRSVLFRVEVN